MRRSLDPSSLGADVALSAEAIAQVSDETASVARDADELHDTLLSVCVMPPVVEWEDFFAELAGADRATLLSLDDAEFWVFAERLTLVQRIYMDGQYSPTISAVEPRGPQPDGLSASIAEVLRGWLDATGPATVEDRSSRLALESPQVEAALIALEAEGQAMRGLFSPDLEEDQTEWCNRRVLARIHRLTLRRLRREIEPVSSADFMRFLQRWQRTASGTRLHGADGLLQVIQ